MSDELKFVISEANKLLNTDYNMISFDSLQVNDLLQVVCNILEHTEITPAIAVNKNVDQAVVNILEVLQKIKYTPPANISPEDFREGVALGKRTIIHPLLFWLLSNFKQVKRRAYLAKFIEKIEIPLELFNDPDVQQLDDQYGQVIEEFWKLYKEYRKEKKQAEESIAMQKDIERMNHDMTKLLQRLENQKEKMENIPNKETLMVIVKAYRNEVTQQRKLEQQAVEQQDLVNKMDKKVRELQETLAQKQIRTPKNFNPLKQILQELQTNRILADHELPNELVNVKDVLDIYESIATGMEPSQRDLDDLNAELKKVSADSQKYLENELAHRSDKKDILAPFRNQATAISNRKQEVSSAVIELKEKINAINLEISEKQDTLQNFVGGPILHGDKLKTHVRELRLRSVQYKEYRDKLQGLTSEVGVLSRTLDVLKATDPSIEEFLSKPEPEYEQDVPDDLKELQLKCKKKAREAEDTRLEAARARQELVQLKSVISNMTETYNQAKDEFEQSTYFISNHVKELEEEISYIEDQIQSKEEKWKNLRREIEKKEQILMRLSEDLLINADESEDRPTQKEILNDKYAKLREQKKVIQNEMNQVEILMKENQEQAEILNGVIMLLKCKKNNL